MLKCKNEEISFEETIHIVRMNFNPITKGRKL